MRKRREKRSIGYSGGYKTLVKSQPDTTYYYVFCAKVEAGVRLNMAYGKTGDTTYSPAQYEWLTRNVSTGEYQWYVGKIVSHPSGIPGGVYEEIGHVYAEVNRDITWNVAYHAIVACPN